MSKKRKKQNLSYFIYFLVGFFVIFLCFIGLEFLFQDDETVEETMERLGYQISDKDDAFYRKNITNITIEQYYSDLSHKKNAEFDEYSVTKSSFDFIEQKLKYIDGVVTNYHFSSNLTSKKIFFQYEYDGNHQYVMMDGNSENDYQCEVVVQNNMTKKELIKHCDSIQKELYTYLQNRADVFNQSAIQKILEDM